MMMVAKSVCISQSGIGNIVVFILMMVAITTEQTIVCLWQLTSVQHYVTYRYFNVDLNEIQSKILHNKILINIINRTPLS